MVKIFVIGGGVMGLSSAVRIKERYPNFEVAVVAEQFSPNTTGDGAGGLWLPYVLGNTPSSLINKWGIESYRLYHDLWMKGGHDIAILPIYVFHREAKEHKTPDWAPNVYGYTELDEKQLAYFSKLYSGQFVQGQCFVSYAVRPPSMLAYLLGRALTLQVTLLKGRLSSLEDPVLKGADVVVNCTGLGAGKLVSDENVFPIRGQVIRVKAGWMNESVIDEDTEMYIIPNDDKVIIGGTHQKGDYNLKLDPKDDKFIVDGCFKLVPALKNAETINKWVGLRPGRTHVRVEREYVNGIPVIHNYGHGGSGFSLFWGCALHVVELLDEELRNNTTKYQIAKL